MYIYIAFHRVIFSRRIGHIYQYLPNTHGTPWRSKPIANILCNNSQMREGCYACPIIPSRSVFDLSLIHAVPRNNAHVNAIRATHSPAKSSPRFIRFFFGRSFAMGGGLGLDSRDCTRKCVFGRSKESLCSVEDVEGKGSSLAGSGRLSSSPLPPTPSANPLFGVRGWLNSSEGSTSSSIAMLAAAAVNFRRWSR